MKFLALQLIKPLWLLCVLCGFVLQAAALDREAFSITKYDLNVRIEPEQHRLGMRGTITLRNDTDSPQKIAVLQISSSLDWKSIKLGDKALQFVTQPLTSDIDHTGSLSEALVTLPQAVAPKGTVDLTIGYEGVIVHDVTRLTRIGTPDDTAASSDWDQIDANFTAVRGAGYVAWYPIATEVANLSDGDLFEVLGRWKAREAEATFTATLSSTSNCTILFSGDPSGIVMNKDDGIATVAVFNVFRLGPSVPTFVLADYKKTQTAQGTTIHFLSGKETVAASYAEVLAGLNPLPELHGPSEMQIAELPNATAAPFVTANLLLTPLRALTAEDRMTLVYALAQRRAQSPRAWIQQGLAHLAQVIDIEHEHGRKAALDYLTSHRSLLAEAERRVDGAAAGAENPSTGLADRSLTDTTDDLYLQSKAMYVWSMLRDMLGDQDLNLVLSSYQAAQDKDSSYMPQLFAKHTQRDLEWFFENWVYRDRGLPDFKIESVFPAKTATDTYIVTVTLDNLGSAGAEVPVIVRSGGQDVVKRIEVRAKSKATIRVETPARPTEVVVNDGSVPESDVTNNAFVIQAASN